MIAALIHILSLLVVDQTCLTNNDKTACGYHCRTARGEVACSQTPAGICTTSAEHVTCWDPPDWVRAIWSEQPPKPQCISRSGNVACGYACVGQNSDVKCASSPDGVCRATASELLCWDPDPSAYCADRRPLPKPQCIVNDDAIACGYGCLARNGEMKCASTPGGHCTNFPGGIVCTDPPAPPMCGYVPCNADSPTSARTWCRP